IPPDLLHLREFALDGLQALEKLRVQLHGNDAPAGRREEPRHFAVARADLEPHPFGGAAARLRRRHANRASNASAPSGIAQEMLSKPLAGHPAQSSKHGRQGRTSSGESGLRRGGVLLSFGLENWWPPSQSGPPNAHISLCWRWMKSP